MCSHTTSTTLKTRTRSKNFSISQRSLVNWHISSFSCFYYLGRYFYSTKKLTSTFPSYFSLTISTLMNLKEEMVLLDVNGVDHNLPISVVHYMLALGWGCFFLGWVMNLIFYGVHPCDVSLSPSSIREKLPDIPIPQSPQPFNGNETYQENGKTQYIRRRRRRLHGSDNNFIYLILQFLTDHWEDWWFLPVPDKLILFFNSVCQVFNV